MIQEESKDLWNNGDKPIVDYDNQLIMKKTS
jgi:hypothetical protein